jgi:hypothetical protein
LWKSTTIAARSRQNQQLRNQSRALIVVFVHAVVLENGGPWHFTIDFIQMRQKKEYESPPSVIASMGDPPRQYQHPEPTCESLIVKRQSVDAAQ